MKRKVEIHEWVVYEFTEDEFARLLGVPERVVSVSVAGGKVVIHAKAAA